MWMDPPDLVHDTTPLTSLLQMYIGCYLSYFLKLPTEADQRHIKTDPLNHLDVIKVQNFSFNLRGLRRQKNEGRKTHK